MEVIRLKQIKISEEALRILDAMLNEDVPDYSTAIIGLYNSVALLVEQQDAMRIAIANLKEELEPSQDKGIEENEYS